MRPLANCPLNQIEIDAIATTAERRKQPGVIQSLETCGGVDGPGLRFVAFLSGCPLRCQYCHNPEAQGRPRGRPTTAGELIDQALTYKNFIRNGGITLSGGEPLMQPDFTRATFQLAKEAGLHTALDTSGFLGAHADSDLLAATDLVLLDIKSGIPSTYQKVTGVDLKPTLTFAQRLSSLGKPMWIRFVLVPNLTDAEANITAVAQAIKPLNTVERVEILPFHQLGRQKYQQLGIPYPLDHCPEPSPQQISKAHELFAAQGVQTY